MLAAVLLFGPLSRWLFRHAGLGEAAYRRPFLSGELLRDPWVVAFLALHLAFALGAREVAGWRRFDPSGRARLLAMTLSGIFLWTYALGAPNPFFHQAYWIDRVLLLVLWILCWKHPGFLGPFLLVFLAVALQGYHPLPEPGWMWPDKRLPLDLLILIEAVWGVLVLWGRRGSRALLPVLLLVVTGAHYAHAGWNKLALGPGWTTWALDNDLSNLMISAWAQGGWLGGMAMERVVALAGTLHRFRVPLALGTLTIELSGFLLLGSWRVARVALPAFVTLHLGILAVSGIFFWKWIVCDLALLWYLARWRGSGSDSETAGGGRAGPRWFARSAVVVGTMALVASPHWLNNIGFAWFDTRVTNSFRFEGEGVSGAIYPIHPRFFAPYDLVVQQSRFYYTIDEKLLVGTYGVSMRYEVLRALQKADAESLPRLREVLGTNGYDVEKANALERFLRGSLAWKPAPPAWLRWLGPPFHFRSSLPEGAYAYQEPLRRLRVTLVETLYDGTTVEVTLRRPVMDLALEPPEGAPGS